MRQSGGDCQTCWRVGGRGLGLQTRVGGGVRELQTTSGLEGALDRRVRARPGVKNGRALYLESCENYRLAGEGGGSMNALLQCDAGKRGL